MRDAEQKLYKKKKLPNQITAGVPDAGVLTLEGSNAATHGTWYSYGRD